MKNSESEMVLFLLGFFPMVAAARSRGQGRTNTRYLRQSLRGIRKDDRRELYYSFTPQDPENSL